MDWSLSKYDDGLDLVPASSDPRFRSTQAYDAAPISSERPIVPTGPSVVVDPSSQIHEEGDQDCRPRPRSLQATMVLNVRQVDELRKEVHAQQASLKRKKLRVLLLWAAAGGGALWLGAFVATYLVGPPRDRSAVIEEPLAADQRGATLTRKGKETGAHEVTSARKAPTANAKAGERELSVVDETQVVVLTLDDLPFEED